MTSLFVSQSSNYKRCTRLSDQRTLPINRKLIFKWDPTLSSTSSKPPTTASMISSNSHSHSRFRVPTHSLYFGNPDHLILFKKTNNLIYYSYDPRQTNPKEAVTTITIFNYSSLKALKVIKIRGHYRILNTIEEKGLLILRDANDKTSLIFMKQSRAFKISRASLGNGFCKDLSQIFYNQQLAKLVFWHAGEITYLLDPSQKDQEVDPIFKTRDGITRVFMDSRHNCLLGFSRSTLKIYSFVHNKVVRKLKTHFLPENILCYKQEDGLILTLERIQNELVFQTFQLFDHGIDCLSKTVIPLLESSCYHTFAGFYGKKNEYVVLKLQYRILVEYKETVTECEFLIINVRNPERFQRAQEHELQLPKEATAMNYSQQLRCLLYKSSVGNIHFVPLNYAIPDLKS